MKNKKIFNVAKIVVRNESGKYLVLKGALWPERPDRSLQPDLPGGTVDGDESHREAARRELYEEAGISVSETDLKPVYFSSEYDFDNPVNRAVYIVTVPDDTEVKISWEHSDYWWSSLKDMTELKWREPYPEIFRYLQEIGVIEIES